MKKNKRRAISTFAILLCVLLLVAIATCIAQGSTYTDPETGETA